MATFEEMKVAVVAVRDNCGRNAAIEIIRSFGRSATLADIKPVYWASVTTACRARLEPAKSGLSRSAEMLGNRIRKNVRELSVLYPTTYFVVITSTPDGSVPSVVYSDAPDPAEIMSIVKRAMVEMTYGEAFDSED